VNCVSYKKARSQEPELETCWLISTSQLDDVASDRVLVRKNIHKVKGDCCPESRGLDPCAAPDRTM
jgi:hypothetical protein